MVFCFGHFHFSDLEKLQCSQQAKAQNKTEPTNCDFISHVHRLCVCASGSEMTETFCFSTLISVSRLHFGQNNGNILNSVSGRIFIRVLLLQTGHNNHSMLLRSLLFVIWFMAAFLSQYNTADNSQTTQCCAPF